jgi:hypothetical protein
LDPTQRPDAALTSFDPPTAAAVAAVLSRAGVPAATRPAADGDVEVVVPPELRDRALRELGQRMEEVRDEVAAARPAPADPHGHGVVGPDEDDLRAGPPLVMERFRSLSWLTAVLLVPLLAVTVAGPLAGDLRRVAAVSLLAVVAAVVWRRRRR